MPITHIHAITQTVSEAVAYGSKDKVEKDLKDDIADSISYARNDKTGEVIYKTLTTTLNCPNGDNDVTRDFVELIDKYNNNENTRRRNYNNDGKRNPLAWHLVQSFDGFIPPHLANQIGRELAQELLGNNFRVQISTHTNTENIHNHIIFCAWGVDGKKYNDCIESKRKIREISDSICESYGIAVLENTRKMKIVKWTDKDGKIHLYEPTDRKNAMIEKRKNGEISKDDISSYRNSESYEDFMRQAKSVREIVRHDIDMFLPFASNYEHLLSLMREHLGYEISDKKKNGDWKEHTSFLPPTADKSVRDYTLDKNGFYTRENLTKYIEDYIRQSEEIEQGVSSEKDVSLAHSHRENEEVGRKEIPILSSYTYSKIDVKMIDENVRAEKNPESGEAVYRKRGEVERKVVKDIKKKDNELYNALYSVGYNSSAIDEMIKRQQEQAGLSKWKLKKEQEAQIERSVQQIQDRLNVLQFMEKNSLQTYEQINSIVQSMWEKYNQCGEKVNATEMLIAQLENLLKTEERLKSVRDRMSSRGADADYIKYELANDKKMEAKYMDLIKKYKLDDPQEIIKSQEKCVLMKDKVERLKILMENQKMQLSMYENCVSILKEIDYSSEKEFANVWSEFDRIEEAGKKAERENVRNGKKKSGREER